MSTKQQLNELMAFHKTKMEELSRVVHECPWENEEFYASWCAQSYNFVCHATRILAACAARLGMDDNDLHLRFLDHCQEEKNHEKLYEQDLQYLRRDAKDYKEHPTAAFLYQNQYYHCEHNHPTAVFGGLFYLEGASVHAGVEIYRRAKKAFSEEACNFLRVHVNNDQEHLDKAIAALSLLTPQQLTWVHQAYDQFSWTYVAMLKELAAQTRSVHKAA